ncbi:class III lanthionine synthetase LanKC [Actinokineospora iranica]|uniref:Lanthionine synthetase C-like protein n=1 Tax=Actinokineospora iranica TaxID=1271860 RepID=A0A1G6Y112_9PSEU|nr:class III lanthionine synthetase LanKC [Actinokineospora iranica]SDD83316.1 Lanthionine synthetase C-like protein [Actinokineospora iranica]
MDLQYEAFCFVDPLFFDQPRQTATTLNGFSTRLPAPHEGWVDGVAGIWRMLRPVGVTLPGQGWKIHVSATLGNAERVLSAVHAHCLDRGLAYKHLLSPSVLLARNSKYAPRSGSGKLVTIYPVDDDSFSQVLAELSTLLDGEAGPYILSDLRIGSGPLYVRYGGFAEQWVEIDGTRVLAVRTPDGTLVPDKREPTFSVPDWVTVPDCLAPHIAARKAGNPDDFPYRVTASMHFSNGGGVYRATRKSDGAEVVLKEARPHAGLDRDGVDAVARLRGEHDILVRLADVDGVPAAHDLVTVWEHTFLAMEPVAGQSLGSWLARTYPLTRQHASDEAVAEYTERALTVLGRVEDLLARVHERGVMFGDLHALNIIIDDDDRVSLIDFEMASAAAEPGRPALGAPGFRAPAGRTGFDVDRYALAALRLWIFLPLNALLELAPGRLDALVDVIERRFPLPPGYGDGIRRELRQTDQAETDQAATAPAATELDRPDPDWGQVRKALAVAILASATPERDDRLFPGDIEQFRVGGACFGYGAAGVLHALDAAGTGRYPEHERWLIDTVRRTPPARPGFFDGAHGIAHVLENLGHHEDAAAVLDGADNLVAQTRDHSLDGGLSGIALNLLHFAGTRHDRDLRTRAHGIGDRLADALRAATPSPFARAGLLNGWSGVALLFLRLHDDTGDRGWLDLAEQAISRDLDECVTTDDGVLQVRDQGARTLPYLSIGSAGIALVAEELAARRPDSAILERQPDLLRACHGEFVIHPGLLFGRCGLLVTLAAAQRRAADPERAEVIGRHLAALGWHAVPHGDGGIAMPGNQLLRLSMDLATGGAGVLLAVTATLDGHGRVLPFLGDAPHPPISGHPAGEKERNTSWR